MILWYSYLQMNPSFLQVGPHKNQNEKFYLIFAGVAPCPQKQKEQEKEKANPAYNPW